MTACPGYAAAVWYLFAHSGVIVVGLPLKERLFAFTLGLCRSSVSEHLAWRRSQSLARTSAAGAPIGGAR